MENVTAAGVAQAKSLRHPFPHRQSESRNSSTRAWSCDDQRLEGRRDRRSLPAMALDRFLLGRGRPSCIRRLRVPQRPERRCLDLARGACEFRRRQERDRRRPSRRRASGSRCTGWITLLPSAFATRKRSPLMGVPGGAVGDRSDAWQFAQPMRAKTCLSSAHVRRDRAARRRLGRAHEVREGDHIHPVIFGICHAVDRPCRTRCIHHSRSSPPGTAAS